MIKPQGKTNSKNNGKNQTGKVFKYKELGMLSSLSNLKQHFSFKDKLMKSTNNINEK